VPNIGTVPGRVAGRPGPLPMLTANMPFVGAYSVPVVGVGLSLILGAWIGVGLLAGAMRRPAYAGS
jgi:hypothetical protein